ncbi:hypothetical protein [Luteibacter sp. RCC_6_2]|uniref:hypothetical protein n=1 Tax=unclassified Luteibacter TaxID=2620188 RepID=UPI0035250E92
MNELLARAMQGVDPDDPGAFLQIFMNLMALVPWGQLILWQVVFVVVGGLLGWWRGRTMAGVVAALILGPFGWVVPFLPRRTPPPLPGSKKR